MAKQNKAAVNWAAIEPDYRAGIKSLRQIASEARPAVTAAAIIKHAKKHGWSRDLGAAIRAKAHDKVNKSAVNKTVNTHGRPITDTVIIEANAELQASIVHQHRSELRDLRARAVRYKTELVALDISDEQLARLAEVIAKTMVDEMPEGEARAKAYKEAITDAWMTIRALPRLGGKVSITKALAEIYRSVIPLERQAFGLDEVETPEGTVLKALKELRDLA